MKTIYFEKDIPRVLATKFAAKHCKPLLYTGLNAVKYNRNLPDPPLPAANWLRVRNIACGLCGTDMSFFKATTGTNSAFEPIPASKRTFLGHENVGIVMEAGPAVTKFKVGDRVTIREYMSGCGNKDIQPRCKFCEDGNYNLCLNYGEPSPHRLPDVGAGWGDTFIAPEQQLAAIYDELTDDQAVMVEPTCVSIHAVLMAPPEKKEKILVMGCGTIGLGVVQAIKIVEPDCEVWIMEKVKTKQDFAKKLGADGVLQLLAAVRAHRSAQGWAAVDAMARAGSQEEAARALGITQQAVSKRRATACWAEENAALPALRRLLDAAQEES